MDLEMLYDNFTVNHSVLYVLFLKPCIIFLPGLLTGLP